MKISVIIPMYNSKNTILQSLESVKIQTYPVFETIVINDGSTDNSADIVKNYIKLNPSQNIIFIDKKNGGVSSARNAGLKKATGDFIALLDSDDEWFPLKTEKQIKLFTENTLTSFIGGLIFEKPKSQQNNVIDIPLKKLVFKNYFQPSTVMFKREILNTVGYFDETQKYAEEGNYFMRIASKFNCKLLLEQVVLYDQGKHGFGQSGLSANLKEMQKGEVRNLKFAVRNGYVSQFKFCIAIVFSYLKYLRRILIVKFKR
jgi:glycosyltransferase involved in cell wall biosynthesis